MYFQVSDQGVAPLVQVTDQSQGIFITDSLNNPVQILDGSLPIIQTSDGNIIQLAQPFMPTGTSEGLTQVWLSFWTDVPRVNSVNPDQSALASFIFQLP